MHTTAVVPDPKNGPRVITPFQNGNKIWPWGYSHEFERNPSNKRAYAKGRC